MVRQIGPHELKARLDAGEPVVLVDVREPDEFAVCRLPGGVLVPLGDLVARPDAVDLPAGAAVVVYCHHGVRSLRGAAALKAAGVADDPASLAGGIDAWSRLIDPTVPRY